MTEMLNNKFLIEDENGKKKEYEVLLLYKSIFNKRNYIVYTDNEKENNIMNVYVKIYNIEDNSIEDINDDIEWFEVESKIYELLGDNNGGIR